MVRKIGTLLLLLILSVLLGACFKAEFKVVVNNDGSGVYKMAVGVTHELSALAKSQAGGENANPLEDGRNKIEELGFTAEVRQWSDDQYEWMESTVNFNSLDELNKLGKDFGNFDQFSLQQEKGFFKNRFVFDAQFQKPDEEVNFEGGLFNPTSFIDLKYIVNLPGTIVETNGTTNVDTGDISWSIDFVHGSSMHAVSESWNWFNITLLVGGVIGTGIFMIAGLSVVAYVMIQRRKSPSSIPQKATIRQKNGEFDVFDEVKNTSVFSQVAAADTAKVLERVKARSYLEQTNQKLLNQQGRITKTAKAIKLEWPGSQEKIIIEVIGDEFILINHNQWPATEAGMKQGLITALKAMNKIKDRS